MMKWTELSVFPRWNGKRKDSLRSAFPGEKRKLVNYCNYFQNILNSQREGIGFVEKIEKIKSPKQIMNETPPDMEQ